MPNFVSKEILTLICNALSIGFRFISLANFLTVGHPHVKLKRSAKESEMHDKEDLSDCKRLAVEYCDKLFEIYQKKVDPLLMSS